MLAEAASTVVVGCQGIQAGSPAAAAAAVRNENILVEIVLVVAALVSSKRHRSIVHTCFAGTCNFVRSIVVEMAVERPSEVEWKLK